MRKVTIIALVVLLSGAGLWYSQVYRRGTNTTGGTVMRNLAVNIDGASGDRTITGDVSINSASLVPDQIAMLQGAFAVEGTLHTRSLPDGKLVLEGNVRMSPTKP